MKDIVWSSVLAGSVWLVYALLSLKFPRLLITKDLWNDLEEPRRTHYLRWYRMNFALLGLSNLLVAVLPQAWQLPVGGGLLAAVFASFLLCNWRLTGWFFPGW